MGIVPFRDFVGVEINGGVVQSETVTDARSTRHVLTNIGRSLYYVDVIEDDGTRISNGFSGNPLAEKPITLAEAVRQANLLALDFGGKVRDRTGNAR